MYNGQKGVDLKIYKIFNSPKTTFLWKFLKSLETQDDMLYPTNPIF